MPTYEYRCKKCEYTFEIRQSIDSRALTHCPACEREELFRVIGSVGFELKGTGWAKDDNNLVKKGDIY